MRTPDEIKNAISTCTAGLSCRGCAYNGIFDCTRLAMKDLLEHTKQIEFEKKALQDRIDLMLIQMRGDCGCCKHKNADSKPQYGILLEGNLCFKCMCMSNSNPDNYKPLWEYEGLPGDEQKGDKT